MKTVSRIIAGVALCLAVVAASAQGIGKFQKPSFAELRAKAGTVVDGQLIVRLTPGTSVAAAKSFAKSHSLDFVRAMSVPNMYLLRIKAWQSENRPALALQAEAELAKDPAVSYVGVDRYYITHDTTPNDPLYSQQWGLRQMKVPATWDFQKGADGVVMCVIDTSMQTDHPDFQLSGGQSVLLPGYNSDDKSTNPNPGANWPDSHGTMVCSVAGAATNNGVGMAGVAYEKVKILPIRATNNPYFFPQNLLFDAYQYVIDYNKVTTHPKVGVLNLSLGIGYSGGQNTAEQDLLKQIRDSGTIICASSGNDRPFDYAGYPCSYPECISIAATGNGGFIASYSSASNGNRSVSKVDLAAPGGDFGGATDEMTVADMRSTYTIAVGTSFAAPMATGAVGLLLSQGVPQAQVFDALKDSANTHGRPVPDNDYGYGEIDLFEALKRFGGSATFITPKQADIFEYKNLRVHIRLGNVVDNTVVLKDGTTTLNYGALINIDGVFKEIDFKHIFATGTHTLSVTANSSINGKPFDPIPSITFQVKPHTQSPGTALLGIPYPIGATLPEAVFPGTFILQRFVYQRDANGNALDPGQWYRYPNANASFHPPAIDVAADGSLLDVSPVGVGYFLTLGVATPVNINDGPDLSSPIRIGLNPGWQMFGNPFPFTIDWNTVEVDTLNQRITLADAVAQEYLKPQIFRWSPISLDYSWRSVPGGQLAPWEGSWVYARKKCWLVVHPLPTIPRRPDFEGPSVSGDGWAMRLNLTGAKGASHGYIGVTSTPNAAYDIVGQAPRPDSGVSLNILGQDGKTAYAQIVKDARQRDHVWTFAVATSDAPDMTLSWDQLSAPVGKVNYTLVDLATGRRLSMNATSSYQFSAGSSDAPRRFQVIANRDASGKLAVTGVNVSSSNGRAGTTFTVNYALSTGAQVQVAIKSASGKTVTILQTGTRASGINSATWNGRDASGIAQAPGVYMAEITATTESGDQVRVVSPIVLKR